MLHIFWPEMKAIGRSFLRRPSVPFGAVKLVLHAQHRHCRLESRPDWDGLVVAFKLHDHTARQIFVAICADTEFSHSAKADLISNVNQPRVKDPPQNIAAQRAHQ